MSRIYKVNSRKFDGTIRRSWECEFVASDDEKIDLVGSFEHQVEHKDLGVIEAGTVSYERFYFNRWFNYFTFEYPVGTLRNYYINICMPPEIGNGVIDYTDLDLDLIVWPDGRWKTLDLEEFEDNKLELAYPESVTNEALETLRQMERLVEDWLEKGIHTPLFEN